MKEFQKGILDNDKIITTENVQCMGEVIALCAIKTVIVRGGKDLHNLYKGLLRDIHRSNDDNKPWAIDSAFYARGDLTKKFIFRCPILPRAKDCLN